MPPPIPDKIPCNHPDDFARELREAHLVLDHIETEENWEKMQRALFRLTAVTRGGAYKLDPQFADGMRWLSKWINNCMLSERARLSGAATDLVTVFAPRLGTRFDPLMGIFVPTLLKLCARTNKLFITRAHTCLSRILETTRLTRVLPMLRDALGDKSQSLRLAATELTAVFVEYWVKCEGDRMKTRWVEDIEVIIKVSARDSNPDIRKTSRRLFESYKLMCPDRIPEFVSPLTPVTRRYLDIKDSMLETMEPLELPPQRIHREKAMARARVEPAPSSSAHPSSSRTEQPFRPVSHHRNLGTTESSAAMPPPHYSSAATSFAPPHPLGRPQHERTPSASSTSSSIHHPSRPASAAASHTELATNAQPNSRLGPARVPVSAGPPSGSKPGPRRVVTAPFRPVSKAHDGPDGGNEVRVRPTRGPPQRIALPPKPVPKPAPAPAPQPAPTKVLKRALSQATLSQAKVKSARTIPSSTSAPPSETSATPTSKADDVLSASVSSTTSQPSVSSNAPKSATSEPTAGTTSTTTATAAGAPAATAPSAPNRPRRPGAPPGFVPKRERTAGGATGATASQLAKMRPPVQRNAAASKAPKGADHASASSKKEKAPVVDPVLAVAVNTPLPGDKSEGKTDGTATADATAREGVKRAEGEIQARPAEELELASAAPVPAAPPAVTTTSLIDLSFTFECLAIGPTSVESDEQKKPSALLELEGLEFTPSASVGSKEIVPEDGARPVLGERKINVDAGAVQPSINGPLFSF